MNIDIKLTLPHHDFLRCINEFWIEIIFLPMSFMSLMINQNEEEIVYACLRGINQSLALSDSVNNSVFNNPQILFNKIVKKEDKEFADYCIDRGKSFKINSDLVHALFFYKLAVTFNPSIQCYKKIVKIYKQYVQDLQHMRRADTTTTISQKSVSFRLNPNIANQKTISSKKSRNRVKTGRSQISAYISPKIIYYSMKIHLNNIYIGICNLDVIDSDVIDKIARLQKRIHFMKKFHNQPYTRFLTLQDKRLASMYQAHLLTGNSHAIHCHPNNSRSNREGSIEKKFALVSWHLQARSSVGNNEKFMQEILISAKFCYTNKRFMHALYLYSMAFKYNQSLEVENRLREMFYKLKIETKHTLTIAYNLLYKIKNSVFKSEANDYVNKIESLVFATVQKVEAQNSIECLQPLEHRAPQNLASHFLASSTRVRTCIAIIKMICNPTFENINLVHTISDKCDGEKPFIDHAMSRVGAELIQVASDRLNSTATTPL